MTSDSSNTVLPYDEYLQALRARMATLSVEDFALLVVAASTALGQLDDAESIAADCNMSEQELSTWTDTVLYDGKTDHYQATDLVGTSLMLRRLHKGGIWDGSEWTYPTQASK